MLNNVQPSRKVKTSALTCIFVIVAMVLATILKTPSDLAGHALWIIGLAGGVTISGQSWVDKTTAENLPTTKTATVVTPAGSSEVKVQQ